MPAEILKMVYSRHGKIPNDDLEFVSSLREAGAVTEEMKKDEHLRSGRKDQEKGGPQEKSQGTPKERSNSKDNHHSIYLFIYLFIHHTVCNPKVMTEVRKAEHVEKQTQQQKRSSPPSPSSPRVLCVSVWYECRRLPSHSEKHG
jgi:hypothetical protein